MSRARLATDSEARRISARAFVRSLNLLLKSARLYGFDHGRTQGQFQTAWEELEAALPAQGELTVGAAGDELILDGATVEATPSERTFAQFLASSGLTSLQFSAGTTRDDFLHLVRGFTQTSRISSLAESLGGGSCIRLNLVRYVAENSSEGRIATELMARALGEDAERLKAWLESPSKLLQLIAAAEGAERQPQLAGTVAEDDVLRALELLSQLGRAGQELKTSGQVYDLTESIERQARNLPADVGGLLERALSSLPQAKESDAPMLLQMAEHLAIHYAMERYQRGETPVNAVRELLDRMSREVENLRSVLGVQEEKMRRAGLEVESATDILDRKFWASVPDSAKLSVLLSREAWCVPPRNIRQFLETLMERAQEDAKAILVNYSSCLDQPDAEARRKVAVGMIELAQYYSRLGESLLESALEHVAQQLEAETVAEIRALLASVFARLSQEAASQHSYGAVEQSLDLLEHFEANQPELAEGLRVRMSVQSRLREFIEKAVQAPTLPPELVEVLQRMASPAAEYLSEVFEARPKRSERERVVALAQAIGPSVTGRLRERLEREPPGTAIPAVGLLSRLASDTVAMLLPSRLGRWNRTYHDWVVRVVAASGAAERGRLLLALLDSLDSLALSGALDEIGMSGDPQCASQLIRLVASELPQSSEPYLRLKAVEALGRLREANAIALLHRLIEAKRVWRWTEPRELRIAAAQSLLKIDPLRAHKYLNQTDLSADELALAPLDADSSVPWIRQRRYPRIHLHEVIPAVATTVRGDLSLGAQVLSLGGGLAAGQSLSPPGTELELELKSSPRNVRAIAVVRDTHSQEMGFEIVYIDLGERFKLRRVLLACQATDA